MVSFGLNLYYEEQVAVLNRHIASINGEIAVHEAANKRDRLEVARGQFEAATGEYKTAVEDYLAAITNRRQLTSQIGDAANKTVDKSGKDHDVSKAMLWMTTVNETRAHLTVGLSAGEAAETNIKEVSSKVWPHRNPISQDDAVRRYHASGPGRDYKALEKMAELTKHWMRSAERVWAIVDEHTTDSLDPVRNGGGWSGDY